MRKVLSNGFLFFFILINSIFSAQSFLPPVDAKQSKIVVVIDPGHGGGDWGINYKGVYEKNINLEVAQRIANKLKKDNPNISVFMTRTDDQFLSINDRVSYANNTKGNIFISIHCDFVPSENISGYKIFYLSTNLVLDKVNNEFLNWDLVQVPYIPASQKLAGFIDQYMKAALIKENSNITGNDEDDVLPMESRGVMGVKSYLLKSINMPAVVVELGNINNRNDFSYLNDKNIIDQIAYHIKQGIINYINKTGY